MFVFSDVLHLLTLLRNHFLDNGYILSHNIISKNSIKQFLKISDSSNLKIVYKITQHMLDVKGSQRQKVSTAAKLLSETTANVIKYCGDNKLISDPNYRATSAFIKLVNDWFDILNTSRKFGNKEVRLFLKCRQ
jgi:predicted small secreted protein